MINKRKHCIHYGVLWFILCIYPLMVIPNSLDYFYFPRYVTLAILSLMSISIISKYKKIHLHVIILLGFFLYFALISTIRAQEPVTAWIGLFGLQGVVMPDSGHIELVRTARFTGFTTYIFCGIIFIVASQSEDGEKLLKGMIKCAVIISFFAVLQYFGINFIPHESYREGYGAYGIFGQPNFLGTYTVFILPAAMLLYLRSGNWGWLLSSALTYAGLLVSLTRGAWLAFFITFILIVIYCFNKRICKTWMIILVCTIILITVFFFLTNNGIILSRVLSIPDNIISGVQLKDNAGSSRLFIWKETLKLLPNYWAFGMGPDHLIYAGIHKNYSFASKAHNIYLEIAITMGVFALIAYLGFIGSILKLKKKKNGFIFDVMIITYLIQGFFNIDTVMIMPLFWIVLGFSVAESKQDSNMNSSKILTHFSN